MLLPTLDWRSAALLTLIIALSLGIWINTTTPTLAELKSDQQTVPGVAVMELFTSQGCSSCPPADQNLSRVIEYAESKNLPVYGLSFHVDYWNGLGWPDPYSQTAFTERQRDYARSFASRRIYTPQMVVNGQSEFVGSDLQQTVRTVSTALKQPAENQISISATLEQQSIQVQFKIHGKTDNKQVVIALVQKQAADNVSAGENNGRYLQHIHVVRDLKIVSPDQSGKKIKAFRLTDQQSVSNFELIAFVQHAETLAITGANHSEIGT